MVRTSKKKYSVPFWFEPHTKSFMNVWRFASEATDGPSLAAASVVEFCMCVQMNNRHEGSPYSWYPP